MAFSFRCNSCNELHEGIPTFGFDTPSLVDWMPEADRPTRVDLGSDDCVIDGERFLVRGCIEIPVQGEENPLIWGAWVDLSKRDFDSWIEAFQLEDRSHIGPFAGYLGNKIPGYPDTFNHHVVMHLRDKGTRPFIEVSASDNPLHKEQCGGMSQERLMELYALVMHGSPEGVA